MDRTTTERHVQEITFRHDRRGACSWILNLIWLVLGGWHMFLTWFFVGVGLCCTCVGTPCGLQAIKISLFLLFPFGKSISFTYENLQSGQCCMRSCNCILNIVWAVTVGWILALQAFFTGCLLMLTIVGIPFGWQCFKLMYLCFCPFGIDFTAEEVETVIVDTSTNYNAMGV